MRDPKLAHILVYSVVVKRVFSGIPVLRWVENDWEERTINFYDKVGAHILGMHSSL